MAPTCDVNLTLVYHDPAGGLIHLIEQHLPEWQTFFSGMALLASTGAPQRALQAFQAAGARVQRYEDDPRPLALKMGKIRARALRLALSTGATHMLCLDCDQALHWWATRRDEMQSIALRLPAADLSVLGRTPSAFDSHPACQRETETPVNRLFSAAAQTGAVWDVMRGARAFSRAAAQLLLSGCHDEAISTDVSWPLFLLKSGRCSAQYIAADGLDFETGDRYPGEIAAAGGYAAWLAQIDANPRNWALRFNFARLHCEAILQYA